MNHLDHSQSHVAPATNLARTSRTNFPIDELPEEIWIAIVKEYVTNPSTNISYVVLDRLLPLILVSRSWEDRILSAPLFWTDIVIESGSADLAAKVSLCIHFSKSAVLSVHFFSAEPWEEINYLLLSNKSRIYTISAQPSYPYSLLFPSRIDRILSQLSVLPQVTRFLYGWEEHPSVEVDLFILANPTLVDVEGVQIDIPTLQHDSRRWRRIQTRDLPEKVVPHIINISSLNKVVFRTIEQPNPQEPPTIRNSFPKLGWSALSLIRMTAFSVSLLPALSIHLTYLGIVSSFEALHNSLPIFAGLTHLETLNIDLSNSINTRSTHMSNLTTTPPKSEINRRLTLVRINHLDRIKTSQPTEIISFCNSFRHIMPPVSTLELFVYHQQDIALFVDNGFSNIEALKVKCWSVRNTAKIDEFHRKSWDLSQTIRSFSINCAPEDFLLFHPAGPTRLDLDTSIAWPQNNTDKAFDLEQWSQIKTLNLMDARIQLTPGYFPSLTRIFCDYNFGEGITTDLCWRLSMDVFSCPALEQLRLLRAPEWDILFIMLERRNDRHNPAISPIKYLEIPTPCHSLQHPIIQVLRGSCASRPENLDISWEGNVEVLYDYSIPGCIECHRMMRVCQTPVTTGAKATDIPILSYPQTSDQILDTWPQRRVAWESMQPPERFNSCVLPRTTRVFTDVSIEDPTYQWDDDILL